MPLRLASWAIVLLLLFAPGQAIAQSTGTSASAQVHVDEQLPWFDTKGVNFTYSLSGTFEGLQGEQTYLGSASVSILGIASNDSLELKALSTAANTIFPNGTLYDDPFFPSYVQAFPTALVVPRSFTVLAPSYGLTFSYLGNVTTIFQGIDYVTYAYSVNSTGSAGSQSELAKYYRILPSTGAVLVEELTNIETGSTVNMTLTSLTLPTNPVSSPFQFSSPGFATPGSFIEYRNTGVGNQTVEYTTIFSEPSGVFAYERTVRGNGTGVGTQFFVDQFSDPFFYPVATSFSNTIQFPVGIGSLERGVLTLKGQTGVTTLDGYFDTHSYANQTIGFEAYLDDSTGVAVYIELPGGFLQLAASNFLTPTTPPSQSPLLSYSILVLFAASICALVYFHYRKPPRKSRRR